MYAWREEKEVTPRRVFSAKIQREELFSRIFKRINSNLRNWKFLNTEHLNTGLLTIALTTNSITHMKQGKCEMFTNILQLQKIHLISF